MNSDKNISEEGNKLFPVFLKLETLHVLLVGGGNVALEKLNAIISNSPASHITVVADKIKNELRAIAESFPNVVLVNKKYEASDLNDIDLVVAAVDDLQLSGQIISDAHKKGLLVNVADKPELCDFYLGSIVRKGDLKIAISTNGKSPTIAKRVKEVLDDAFPDETQEVLENLSHIRNNLKGNFSDKVKELNKITAVLVKKQERSIYKKVLWAAFYSFMVLLLMFFGHLFLTYVPLADVKGFIGWINETVDKNIWIYMLGGFIAQMIDGALGMAYGVSVTTFLLSLGIPAITPAVASASMHASEVFTTGSSSLVYMRYKNVNMKLFKKLVVPGALGAIFGAASVSFISKEYFYIIKPLVALYTLTLGVFIIIRALKISNRKTVKIKKIIPVAAAGGYLDSVGGGGWGPIVTTSLIAGGRNLRYAVGSSHLAKFFVALISTLTFFIFLGLSHWQIIFGLVIGGMLAAPISIYFSNKIPIKAGLILVGSLVIAISLRIVILSLI